MNRFATTLADGPSNWRAPRLEVNLVGLLSRLVHEVRLFKELIGQTDDATSPVDDLAKRIHHFMLTNLHRGLTLKDLAKFLGYSEKELVSIMTCLNGPGLYRMISHLATVWYGRNRMGESSMKRIGDHVPSCRIPALVKGALQYVELGQFKPRWVLLCFLPRLTQIEASILHQQADFGFMAESEVSLVAVGPETTILHESWTRQISGLHPVILADPLHRLHRAFGIEPATASRRCQSFVIDPDGILQFLMVHDLNGCGVSALAEIFKAGLAQPAR